MINRRPQKSNVHIQLAMQNQATVGQEKSGKVKGAAKGGSPDTVEHFAILWNSKQFVVSGDIVEIGTLLVGKEQIWFPNGVQHRWVQVQGIIRVFAVCQPWVIPLLSQKNVHSVILQERHAWERVTAHSGIRGPSKFPPHSLPRFGAMLLSE